MIKTENNANEEAKKRWPLENIESKACRGAFVRGVEWQASKDLKVKSCLSSKKIKKGQKIKLYFRCAGVISEEERTIDKFNKQFIWTDALIHPNNGKKEQPEKFDRRNGRCVNDNTMFGTCRSIDPQ